MQKPKMLVHICCAPDAVYVIDLLQKEYDVTGYFYNPNIHSEEEYQFRLEETRKVAEILNFKVLEETYDPDRWLLLTERFRGEPEKGKRCDICYALRLEKTSLKAAELSFDFFTTVMSLSPWKKADVLNRIGLMFAHKNKINFMEADFKKKDGFKKSIELSKHHHLYRQDYCGCVYSQRSK